MHHSSIGNIRAYLTTIEMSKDPRVIKSLVRSIQKELNRLIETTLEIEQQNKAGSQSPR